MKPLPNNNSAKEMHTLLNKLNVDLGFDLALTDVLQRFISIAEIDVEQFIVMVFQAEQMDPDKNLHLKRQVRKMFTDRFGRSISFGNPGTP